MTKRNTPMALPKGLTRMDVLYYVCEAIEASPEWAERDGTMRALVDELMTSTNIRATLKRHIPDAEWEEAFRLISTKAPHHRFYAPPA